MTTTLVYAFVTTFLMLTAFFAASYVAEAPQERMRRIVRAYTIVAVFSAVIGTLGYLHLIPGGYDILTRYGRAKALFQDPNVFAPFLILPALVLRCSACCSAGGGRSSSTAPSSWRSWWGCSSASRAPPGAICSAPR